METADHSPKGFQVIMHQDCVQVENYEQYCLK